MSDNPVIAILKRLAGIRPDDVQAAATALEGIKAELASAHAELSAATADFGARLVEALADGKAAEVEAELEAKRVQVARLERAQEAVAQRLAAAREVAGAAELAKRWRGAEVALSERSAALARFERAVTEAGKALLEAEAAASRAWQAMPVKPSGGPHCLSLEGELSPLLSLATDGHVGGYRGSLLWELRRRPGLVARAEANGREWLRLGAVHLGGTEPPPNAA